MGDRQTSLEQLARTVESWSSSHGISSREENIKEEVKIKREAITLLTFKRYRSRSVVCRRHEQKHALVSYFNDDR